MSTGRRSFSTILTAAAVFGAMTLGACTETAEDDTDTMGADTMPVAAPDTQGIVISDGLSTPESVLHDAEADVYLVSNIQGEPLRKDGNGYISRVRPGGTVEAERWIEGGSNDVTLHAPKGMAIRGDTLFVADIDTVRAFSRQTGEPWGGRGIQGASFLNDLAMGDDALYVTDTGVDASFAPVGNAAIYRFVGNGAERVAQDVPVETPNGITIADGALWLVSFGGGDVQRIPLNGDSAEVVATLPGGQLDGIVRLDDGTLLVSSWETSTVYRVTEDGQSQPVVENVEAPADIGFDRQRGRVLIPLFTENRVEIRPVP